VYGQNGENRSSKVDEILSAFADKINPAVRNFSEPSILTPLGRSHPTFPERCYPLICAVSLALALA